MSEEKLTLTQKIEKGRAEFAYGCVKEAIEKLKEKERGNYRSYTRKIPSMILSNGTGQTLAFISAKKQKEEAYKVIYKQINQYFKNKDISRITMPQNKEDILEWVVSCDSKTEYRYITNELLALFNWLKRFAEGMIEDKGEQS